MPSRRILKPALWALDGFAVVPTAALDPPQRAASPAVPALHGSGSPSRSLPERRGKSFPESGKFFPVPDPMPRVETDNGKLDMAVAAQVVP